MCVKFAGVGLKGKSHPGRWAGVITPLSWKCTIEGDFFGLGSPTRFCASWNYVHSGGNEREYVVEITPWSVYRK